MRTLHVAIVLLTLLISGCIVPSGPNIDPNARIVVFGDSTVRGPAEDDFAEKLPALLNLGADEVANAGQGGELLLFGKERLRNWVEQGVYPAAETLIFVEGGNELLDFMEQNDPALDRLLGPESAALEAELLVVLDQVQQDLNEVVTIATDAGWTIYLMTYQPIAGEVTCRLAATGVLDEADRPVLDAYASLLNDRIRQVANTTGAQLIDVATLNGSLLANPNQTYHDCTHLSGAGNQLVAELVATRLRS